MTAMTAMTAFKATAAQEALLQHVPNAVGETLLRWHAMIATGDLGAVAELLHDDAVFRSPMAHQPYQSAAAVALILSTVAGVFRDFKYERELASPDGLDVVLEFRARVGDRELKGVDLIRFGVDGRIREFEVMIRPLSGLEALGREMGARLGAVLPRFKAPITREA